MGYAKPLEGIDKKLGFVYLRWHTGNEIGHRSRKDDKRMFFVSEWSGR